MIWNARPKLEREVLFSLSHPLSCSYVFDEGNLDRELLSRMRVSWIYVSLSIEVYLGRFLWGGKDEIEKYGWAEVYHRKRKSANIGLQETQRENDSEDKISFCHQTGYLFLWNPCFPVGPRFSLSVFRFPLGITYLVNINMTSLIVSEADGFYP